MPNLNSQMHPKHPQIQFPQSLLGPTPSNLDSPTACRAPTSFCRSPQSFSSLPLRNESSCGFRCGEAVESCRVFEVRILGARHDATYGSRSIPGSRGHCYLIRDNRRYVWRHGVRARRRCAELPTQSVSHHRELGEAPRGAALGIDGGSRCRSPRQYMGGREMRRKYLRRFKPSSHPRI